MPSVLQKYLCLAALVAPITSATAAAQALRYEGTVTNHGYGSAPVVDGLTGTLVWNTNFNGTQGNLVIGSPLAGSGIASGVTWADTVFIMSMSATGDAIAWLGANANPALSGEYTIGGGPNTGRVTAAISDRYAIKHKAASVSRY